MTYRNLGNKAHYYIHFIAIAGIAVGLPLNKIVMSLAMIIGVLNLIIESDFKRYWQNIRSQKLIWLITAFWLFHVLGLLWTNDLDFGLKDIRVKLPLLVIPVLLIAKPLATKKERDLILNLFLLSILVTSFINFAAYQHWIGNHEYNDIRGLSLFGSHIRFGILVAMGAIISLYFFIENGWKNYIYLSFFLWLCFYTNYSQIISGSLGLISGLMAVVFFYLFHLRKKLAVIFGVLMVLFPIVAGIIYFKIDTGKPITSEDLSKLPVKTAEGNDYIHYFVEQTDSKGNYLFINLCETELRREWNSISTYDYDGKDKKGQEIRFTLIRYMTSMGLLKDAKDFKKLSKEDIHNIEIGIAEKDDSGTGIFARLNGVKFQLKGKANPNGHSLLQRFEYWKTGARILKKNWVIGVGTGDLQQAFNAQYDHDKSILVEGNRLRAHNTYMTVWISFGISGFLLFLFLLGNLILENLRNFHLVGFAFTIIAISTFLLEDTLETQTGVTFFAFFYALFLYPVTKGKP